MDPAQFSIVLSEHYLATNDDRSAKRKRYRRWQDLLRVSGAQIIVVWLIVLEPTPPKGIDLKVVRKGAKLLVTTDLVSMYVYRHKPSVRTSQ